ncbi:sugar ABC transporter permease [Paenibacillus sp. GP183]|uniref:carbohydrate ABC transporter permease n=1 Tax=Paenibacillus sp. GP183 TaxID=1882751 RepID=UPI00089BC7CC|nr:sugar ABC transporter permease [Paenibacillus sp. GP183]SEC63679.1 carbohydrate ABC transporter membrane protein 1, CUT1 family [Paenibacillus sp. GP183]
MRRHGWRKNLRDVLTGYTFMSPAILILGTFVFLPVIYAVYLSFNKVNLLGDVSYKLIWFKNFARIAQDERAWIALKNTASFVLFVVPLQSVLALLLASILNAKLKGKNLFRVIFFLPTVTSSAVLTLIFMWIYNSNGLLNHILSILGLPEYNWLGDPAVALKGIMLMNIWSTAPYFMVIYLAALQDIPDSLYESAKLDGANAWSRFIYITYPMLKPATFFVVVMGIIGTFQLFDQSYIFSAGSGGPNNSTLTLALLIYQYAFKNLDMGYASALAVLLAIVIMGATLIQRRLFTEEKLN